MGESSDTLKNFLIIYFICLAKFSKGESEMLFKSVDPVSPNYSSMHLLINSALSQSMFQLLDYLTKQFSIFTGVILFFL